MNVVTTTRPLRPRFPAELVKSTTFLLKRLGFTAKDSAMEAYERAGLSPYHHAVLVVLDEGSRDTQGSIADALGYDRGQLVGLLDELEIHLIPVLLGRGRRLFDNLRPEHIELERTRILEGEAGVTHMHYRVAR